MAHDLLDVRYAESAFIVLAEDEPNSYKDAMNSPNAAKWRPACEAEYDVLMWYHTVRYHISYVDIYEYIYLLYFPLYNSFI